MLWKIGPLAFVCVLSLLASDMAHGAGRADIIEVLYIARWACFRSRFDKMVSADPSVDVFGVPMPGTFSIGKGYIDAADLNRRMRMYMPRTLDQLVTERDAVVMHDAPLGHHEVTEVYFDPKWVSWFVDGVLEEGMSFSMWGGDASWGGGGEGDYPSWGNTILDTILPLESVGGYNPLDNHERRFRDPNHPLSKIPWREVSPIEHVNVVDLKPGVTPLADAVSKSASYPWIALWEVGKGRAVGETEIFGSAGTSHAHDGIRRQWRWYQDFLVYLVYLSVDKAIPDDVLMAHRIRQEFNLHIARNSLMASILDFVANFGASTLDLHSDLDEINRRKKQAEDHYRNGNYDAAAEVFAELEEAWIDLDVKAMNVKKKALTWVYLIEWFTINATAILAGVFLWMAMVRRRLYHEVGITRRHTTCS